MAMLVDQKSETDGLDMFGSSELLSVVELSSGGVLYAFRFVLLFEGTGGGGIRV